MKTVIIGVSSGIAAFKVIPLVKSIKRKRYNVIVIMTKNACKMISPIEFGKASGNKVLSELFPKGFDYKQVLKQRKVRHISLADKASLIAIVPATANVMAKIANGIADDLLTTTVLATKAPILMCPSMNVNMWNNKATQENYRKLIERGIHFIEPEKGMLACGYEGTGRLADIDKIESRIITLLRKSEQLKGKKIIVTAGRTEEDVDDIRVITNKSSGKMGLAIAEEFVRRGAYVVLIRGRTDIEPVAKLEDIRIRTAEEMREQLQKRVNESDILVHTAAVGDFKVRRRKGKIKSGKKTFMELIPNAKIIEEIKRMNRDIFLVGFKAEYDVSKDELRKRAFESLKKSHAEIVIANDVSKGVFGSDFNNVTFLYADERIEEIERSEKRKIAGIIADRVAERQ